MPTILEVLEEKAKIVTDNGTIFKDAGNAYLEIAAILLCLKMELEFKCALHQAMSCFRQAFDLAGYNRCLHLISKYWLMDERFSFSIEFLVQDLLQAAGCGEYEAQALASQKYEPPELSITDEEMKQIKAKFSAEKIGDNIPGQAYTLNGFDANSLFGKSALNGNCGLFIWNGDKQQEEYWTVPTRFLIGSGILAGSDHIIGQHFKFLNQYLLIWQADFGVLDKKEDNEKKEPPQ